MNVEESAIVMEKEHKVRYTAAGMDFLESGIIRCQTCQMMWDDDTSYQCLCGDYYYPSTDRIEFPRESSPPSPPCNKKPLYQRTMNALAMPMCNGERLTPLKRKNENEPPHDAKRKKDRDNMGRADETSEIMNVRDSAAGMDFLENGLVRCQACDFEWDGDAQHECTKDGDAADINMKL